MSCSAASTFRSWKSATVSLSITPALTPPSTLPPSTASPPQPSTSSTSSLEVVPSLLDVAGDLGPDFVDAGELLLWTEAVHELRGNRLAVDVSREVQDVALDGALLGVERRPHADVDCRWQLLTAHVRVSHVYSVAWDRPALAEAQVGRRESD